MLNKTLALVQCLEERRIPKKKIVLYSHLRINL